jgi:maleylpyruvate isomerase
MSQTGVGQPNRPGDPVHADSPAEQAAGTLAAVERATLRLLAVVREFDDKTIRAPSLLPGWTRGHVLSHLARNADGCVNVLRWARTGVEHPMYPSAADREAAIEKGAARGRQLLEEDLIASSARFSEACRSLPASAWSAEVMLLPGRPVQASEVVRSRLLEVWVHLVDLDTAIGFADIPEADAEDLLDDAVQQLADRPGIPGCTVTVEFDGNRHRTWTLDRPDTSSRQVTGRPGAVLSWLLGRPAGEQLEGAAPDLPVWP